MTRRDLIDISRITNKKLKGIRYGDIGGPSESGFFKGYYYLNPIETELANYFTCSAPGAEVTKFEATTLPDSVKYFFLEIISHNLDTKNEKKKNKKYN